MFGIIYHRHLFQRKKRSLSSKKKMTRKPPSKTKPKPLKAKKYSTKKKHQMPGYQATAPEQHRGDIRVKIHFEIREHPIKIFPPWILKGKSVMADFIFANLLSVEVAATSVSLRRPQQITSSLSFYANLYSSLLFFNMTQINNLEGDYNTDIDYGTVDGTQTQSPFATSGPNEVIFN